MQTKPLTKTVAQLVLRSLIAGATLISASTLVHAQALQTSGTHTLTRAEVRHELEELEAAGYDSAREGSYPDDLQAAERKVAAWHQADAAAMAAAGKPAQSGPAT
ncbi:hypothetical protein UB46_41065 [Burkholderiaceae bacterium 16]|nr:hypothetical protein UB46_41065 [Burkholderiaceae bacterium 16]